MAMQPRSIEPKDEEENPEFHEMKRRFWVAALLTIPLVVVAMGDLLPGKPISALLSARWRTLLELALAAPVCTWAAWPFYLRFVRSIKNLSLNMFTLIGLGVSVAFLHSLVATLAPALFPDPFRGESGHVAVSFEASGVIVTLILLGQVLELRARSQTSSAIKLLLGMAAKSARRIAAPDDRRGSDGLSSVSVFGNALRLRRSAA